MSSTDLDVAFAMAGYVALCVAVLCRVVSPYLRRFVPRDPQRRFDANQRRLLLAYAGNRCEHLTLWVFRCTQTRYLQADHVMPWSRGGQTTIENGQMLCRRHNSRKTNRVPSLLYRWRHRRRQRRTSAAYSARPKRFYVNTRAPLRTGSPTASKSSKTPPPRSAVSPTSDKDTERHNRPDSDLRPA